MMGTSLYYKLKELKNNNNNNNVHKKTITTYERLSKSIPNTLKTIIVIKSRKLIKQKNITTGPQIAPKRPSLMLASPSTL